MPSITINWTYELCRVRCRFDQLNILSSSRDCDWIKRLIEAICIYFESAVMIIGLAAQQRACGVFDLGSTAEGLTPASTR